MDKKKAKKLPRMSAEQRKEQILSTACELFYKNGYDAVTTKQISEAMGCSEALIFKYFPTKDAIYTTLLNEWEDGMNEPVELELVFNSALKTLEKFYNEIVVTREWKKNSKSRPHLESAILSRTGMGREHARIVSKSPDTVKVVITPLIELGQEQEEIRRGNPEELAQLFWSTIIGIWYLNRHFPGRYPTPPFSSVVYVLKPK